MKAMSLKSPRFLFLAGILFLAGTLLVPAPAAGGAKADLPLLDITFRPIKPPAGEVTHLEVAIVLPSKGRASKEPLKLAAPVKYTNISGITDRIENFKVADAKGDVAINRSKTNRSTEAWSSCGGGKPSGKRREMSGFLPGPCSGARAAAGSAVRSAGLVRRRQRRGCGFMALPDEPTKFKSGFTGIFGSFRRAPSP